MNNKWVVFLTLAVVSSYAMEQQRDTNFDDLSSDNKDIIWDRVFDKHVAVFGINSGTSSWVRSIDFSRDGKLLQVFVGTLSSGLLFNYSTADWKKEPIYEDWDWRRVQLRKNYWVGKENESYIPSSSKRYYALIETNPSSNVKEVSLRQSLGRRRLNGEITITNPLEIPQAISNDACYIASGNHSLGADTSVRIRSVPDNKVVNSFNHDKPVLYVAISPDNKYIASAGERTLVVRDFFNCVLGLEKVEAITTIRGYIFVKELETNKRKKVFLLNENGYETWQKLKNVLGQDFTLYKRSVKLKQRKTGEDELSDTKSIDRWALVRKGCKITDK